MDKDRLKSELEAGELVFGPGKDAAREVTFGDDTAFEAAIDYVVGVMGMISPVRRYEQGKRILDALMAEEEPEEALIIIDDPHGLEESTPKPEKEEKEEKEEKPDKPWYER
tara:strand:+ start:794 stop:1126 length:333 start_codon:yes stop_codon:yes gene_type:complete